MARVKQLGISLAAAASYIVIAAACLAADSPAARETPEIVKWYQQHYPFATNKDSIYTFETEFALPPGFSMPDSQKQTDFQNWVAHFPLWHRWRSVGNFNGRKLFEADSVSRPVHLPWVGRCFTDDAIPLRILAEYLHYRSRESEFRVWVQQGAELGYLDWLRGKIVFDSRMKPRIEPDTVREPSDREFYRFMTRCMEISDYRSLVQNCDSLGAQDLMPGDLVVGFDKSNLEGKTYVVLRTLFNEKGDKLHAVATGCAKPCDFHIPLLTGDRNRPWVDAELLSGLVAAFPQHGFFRLRQVNDQ
jgi:hypothetical protein